MFDKLQNLLATGRAPNRLTEDLSAADQVKLKVERHILLLRGAPTAISISAIIAVITLAAAWGKIDHVVLGSWTAIIVVFAAVRLLTWWRFSRLTHSPRALLRFTQLHIAAMGVNGVIFGALAPIFTVNGLLGHAFLPFVIAGMTAATISSASASWKAVVAFNFPVLASFSLSYIFFMGTEGILIALVVSLYGVATAYLASRVQSVVERSIKLRSRNQNLLNALTRQVDEANEAEQRYRALVEVSNDLTLIFSPEGRVTYASPSAERILGLSPRMLIGRSTRKIVHPDDVDQFRSAGSQSLANLGDVKPLSHICLRNSDGGYEALTGRMTNMLYVPGVEGFVFSGGMLDSEQHAPCPIVAAE